jgi:Fur family zinc uptake transcriptional regulator
MLSNSRSAYHHHDHQRCIDAALVQAKQRCDQAKVRMTPIREAVLQLIWRSHKPLGAYTLVEQLPTLLGKRVQAPTVYRAIDFLQELGLIHRLPSLNAFIGCPFPGREHSDIFMVCRDCGAAAEVSADNLNNVLAETSRKTGFLLESQTVELNGLCPQCQEKAEL